jgi:zinc-ribbon domain
VIQSGGGEDKNMAEIERICPNCGTNNPSGRTRCTRCGTNLTSLPARRESNLPARLESASAAALVLSASAFLARAGLKLLAREVLPRMAKGLATKPASKQIVKQAAAEEPDYVIRGWRTWSVRRGDERTSGSEQFEWRINRASERRTRKRE